MKTPPHQSIQLPLAFGNRRALPNHDPDHLAQLVSQAVPLRDLSPRQSPAPFVHWSVHVQAADLGITAAAHSPLQGSNHAHSKAVFTLPTMGEKRFLINGRTHRARAGHCALFLPGEAYTLETTHCSGVMFSLCPKELAALATTMAGGQESQLCSTPIHHPVEFLESHPQQGKILSLLRRSLQLIDSATLHGPSLPRQLGLDDKLQRLIALLLYPQLIGPPASEAGRRIGKRELDSFEDLLVAVQGDLLGHWTLTRMERQAGLSHGQLQQLFQHSFSCGPLEWLRHRRLCWARQRLDASDPISLAELAPQCGYSDPQSFRRDFEAQFLLDPERIHPDLSF